MAGVPLYGGGQNPYEYEYASPSPAGSYGGCGAPQPLTPDISSTGRPRSPLGERIKNGKRRNQNKGEYYSELAKILVDNSEYISIKDGQYPCKMKDISKFLSERLNEKEGSISASLSKYNVVGMLKTNSHREDRIKAKSFYITCAEKVIKASDAAETFLQQNPTLSFSKNTVICWMTGESSM